MEQYAINGVLPKIPESPSVFKKHTRRNLVVKTNHAPVGYNESNPNPMATFKGVDGKWYKFIVSPYVGNCYAFALGIIYDARHSGYYVPGFLVERYPLKNEEVIGLITKDLEVLGRKVHEVIYTDDIPEVLPKAEPNTYWIKIMFGSDEMDFHTARFDELSGRWIHILGWQNPPKVFMRNLEIGKNLDDQLRFLISSGEFSLSTDMPEDMFITCAKQFAKSAGIKPTPFVIRSEYEDCPAASYFAFNPEEKDDGFIEYKTYAIMRIDY